LPGRNTDGQGVRGKRGDYLLGFEVSSISNQARIPGERAHNAEISHQSRRCSIGLSKFEIRHIPREENAWADLLSKLASTQKTSNYHSVVEEVIPCPSFTLQVQEADWRTPLINYIERGVTPEDDKESKK
jgi:hypothetical protein